MKFTPTCIPSWSAGGSCKILERPEQTFPLGNCPLLEYPCTTLHIFSDTLAALDPLGFHFRLGQNTTEPRTELPATGALRIVLPYEQPWGTCSLSATHDTNDTINWRLRHGFLVLCWGREFFN